MKKDATEAVIRLMVGRARDCRSWNVDRHEEAIDIILRNPDRSGNPNHMARNALRDADRKLQRRAELIELRAAEIDVMAQSSLSRFQDDEPYTYDETLIDVVDMLRRGVGRKEAEVLSLAFMHDLDDVDLAHEYDISRDAARQRLSRARRRAKAAWEKKH